MTAEAVYAMKGLAGVLGLFVLTAACGAQPPPASWIESDSRGDTVHATHESSLAVAPDSLARLDPTAIDQLDEATVLAALQRIGDAAPAARLALRAARLAYHRGDEPIARTWIVRAASAVDEPSVHAELIALGAQLAYPPVDPKLIAVLLPLTGRFSRLGSELRTAIQLAPPSGTSWLFLDTHGEPAAAVAAVEQAIAKGAAGILGPVGEREAVAAARAAAMRSIPIALLAPSDGADPAAGVFRMVDSPADEARAIAQLAADESFPTVAVFAPRDDVGAESAEAFVAEATRLGVPVTGQGTYDPTGGNLEPDIKKFLNLVPATNPRFAAHLRRRGKKHILSFSPEIPYALLYIPDRYDRAALIAAYLPYYGVELRTAEFHDPARLQRKHGGTIPQVVQLIGGAGWNHPTLPVRGGAAVQGALVVDAFPGVLGGDTGALFVSAFHTRTNRAPSAVAAQAHDAATVIAHARKEASTSPDPRGALRAALARAKLDDGACGPAEMGRDGELVREPAVLEVQGDQLVLMP